MMNLKNVQLNHITKLITKNVQNTLCPYFTIVGDV